MKAHLGKRYWAETLRQEELAGQGLVEWVSRAQGGDGGTRQGLEAVLGKAASCPAALAVSWTQQTPPG